MTLLTTMVLFIKISIAKQQKHKQQQRVIIIISSQILHHLHSVKFSEMGKLIIQTHAIIFQLSKTQETLVSEGSSLAPHTPLHCELLLGRHKGD